MRPCKVSFSISLHTSVNLTLLCRASQDGRTRRQNKNGRYAKPCDEIGWIQFILLTASTARIIMRARIAAVTKRRRRDSRNSFNRNVHISLLPVAAGREQTSNIQSYLRRRLFSFGPLAETTTCAVLQGKERRSTLTHKRHFSNEMDTASRLIRHL